MDDSAVISKYYELRSCRAVADLYGCSDETIRRTLKRNNVALTGWKQTEEHALSKKKYPRKSNYTPVSYEKTCAYCGKDFVAHNIRGTYCSKKCKDIAIRIRKGIKCNPNTEPYHKTCVVCGKPFDSYREASVTCSTECSALYRKPRKTKSRGERNSFEGTVNEKFAGSFEYVSHKNGRVKLKCKTCGVIIERAKSTVIQKNVRCENCREMRDAQRELVRVLTELRKARTPRTCQGCGKTFFSMCDEQKYCSQSCRHKARKSRNSYRSRCRHYGAYYDPQVTREKVLERDGYVCQVCGKKCDENDRSWGSSGPDFPTLDHIVPLAKGGTHTWDNVQCACGICNSYKRDLLEYEPDEKCS